MICTRGGLLLKHKDLHKQLKIIFSCDKMGMGITEINNIRESHATYMIISIQALNGFQQMGVKCHKNYNSEDYVSIGQGVF